jgi:hypothetical protein
VRRIPQFQSFPSATQSWNKIRVAKEVLDRAAKRFPRSFCIGEDDCWIAGKTFFCGPKRGIKRRGSEVK